MKHILSLLYIFLSTILLQSCSHDEEPTPPPAVVNRTVLVYMLASGNGLGASAPADYDLQDIDEMLDAARAGDIKDGRLLIYHSCSNGNMLLKEVTRHGIDTLKYYDPGMSSQSYTRMTEVLDDAKTLAPANDYGLVMWGHGRGWLEESTVADKGPIQTYAYGWEQYDYNNSINVTTLAKAFEGRNLSFIYFDCCYMAGVEVAYELRHATPTIVAYPTEILGWGMPYDQNVKHFFSPTPDMVAAAKNTFDYYDSFTDKYRMATVSVINTAGLDRLADVTREIYRHNTIGLAPGYSPQRYTTAYECNYYDFGSYVKSLSADDALCQEFDDAMAEVIIYEDAYPKIWGSLEIKEHSGLSTYILKTENSANSYNYKNLSWYEDVASYLN